MKSGAFANGKKIGKLTSPYIFKYYGFVKSKALLPAAAAAAYIDERELYRNYLSHF